MQQRTYLRVVLKESSTHTEDDTRAHLPKGKGSSTSEVDDNCKL